MGRLTMLKPRLRAMDQATAKIPPKVAEPFYKSRAWKGLAADVMADEGKRCRSCGQKRGRMIVDHIVERRDGGAELDRANCQVICIGCHNAKTAKARAERANRAP